VTEPGPPPPGTTAQREARARAEPQTHITLLRHGEPDWSPAGGRSVSDPGLTPFGQAQARAVAKRLSSQRFDAIYVSPYRRSQETAVPLAEALGIEPVTVDGLAEIGVSVEGLTQEEVDRYFVEGSKRPLEQHWEGWPGAESFVDFHTRVTGGVTDVLGRHGLRSAREQDFTIWEVPDSPACIAIVAHGGTNACALTHLLDIDPVPWEWLRFETQLAAFSVLQTRAVGSRGAVWSLQNFNEVDHLASAGLR